MSSVAEDVDRRIENGWRPSLEIERTWVKGSTVVVTSEDRIEDLEGAVLEPMTSEEEQELITRTYAVDPLDGEDLEFDGVDGPLTSESVPDVEVEFDDVS